MLGFRATGGTEDRSVMRRTARTCPPRLHSRTRERSGEEGTSSGNKPLRFYQELDQACNHRRVARVGGTECLHFVHCSPAV